MENPSTTGNDIIFSIDNDEEHVMNSGFKR